MATSGPHIPSADGVANEHVVFITTTPDGKVWVVSSKGSQKRDLDLSLFDGEKWTRSAIEGCLYPFPPISYGLAADGTWWFGTRGGICSFDGSNWVSHSVEDGLDFMMVQAIAEAPDGTMWFGTGFGILQYLPPQ